MPAFLPDALHEVQVFIAVAETDARNTKVCGKDCGVEANRECEVSAFYPFCECCKITWKLHADMLEAGSIQDASTHITGTAAGLAQGDEATYARAEAAGQSVLRAAPAPEPELLPALIVDKPLRSGQQVYARGRDLVVLAMVNPGAEVIADGHIHVYAPLRGKAIAGARGNIEARIFALAMEPELVSIAGIYRTSEVPWPDEVLGKPTQVRLFSGPDGDKLVMDAIKP